MRGLGAGKPATCAQVEVTVGRCPKPQPRTERRDGVNPDRRDSRRDGVDLTRRDG